ncbi:enolase C-terminal domain-like protein [Rhizohabitans arisaemae]|uniref:enolase C-terminal domain-like protein n=1 Tax=Rhizohabitans arisaemae TaxID=2720610 RepID=UPI0024B0D835|nr:enolase C-terminal domain-like protein [Rhizohabitans arisaemae]
MLPQGRRPESVLIRLTEYGGMTAWGEIPEPGDAEETLHRIERDLGPALVGVDWEHPDELGVRPEFDLACWDLWCRMTGVPLAHALGGSRTNVVAGVRVPAERDLDSLLSRVNRFMCAGYAHITLTITPGWDLEPLRAVRRLYPALAISVDGRRAYRNPEELAALDGYGLLTVERPFAGLQESAELQIMVDAAVAPHIEDLPTLKAAIDAKAGRALTLRVSRLGGLSTARRAYDMAVRAGWDAHCAREGGTGIARAAALALASMRGCTFPSDVSDAPPRLGKGVRALAPDLSPHGGVVAVPLTQPGIGHTVDEEIVRRLAKQTVTV